MIAVPNTASRDPFCQDERESTFRRHRLLKKVQKSGSCYQSYAVRTLGMRLWGIQGLMVAIVSGGTVV